jgi:hypothetical protein
VTKALPKLERTPPPGSDTTGLRLTVPPVTTPSLPAAPKLQLPGAQVEVEVPSVESVTGELQDALP